MHGYRSQVTLNIVRYCPKPFISDSIENKQTNKQTKTHGVALALCTFESLAPRLQCHGLKSATNLIHSHYAYCHPSAWEVAVCNHRNC